MHTHRNVLKIVAGALICVLGLTGWSLLVHDSAQGSTDISLKNGTIYLGDLVTQLSKRMDEQTPDWVRELDVRVAVESDIGRKQLDTFRQLLDGAIDIDIDAHVLSMNLDADVLRAEWDRTAENVEAWMRSLTGKDDERDHERFGVFMVTGDDPFMPVSEMRSPPKRLVLLVHGLDDPGWMWRDMIPALRDAGFDVARFEYPNDGPITDSSAGLIDALRELRAAGIEHVNVVAHSMGGLVTRDVLTRTDGYAGHGAATEALPAIDRLIMLGTPNHGSVFARLRGVAEVKDHISRALAGEAGWLNFRADGRGEAGVDLLPESQYLNEINNRPLASHTLYTIVAGRMSPLDHEHITTLKSTIDELVESEAAPAWIRNVASRLDSQGAEDLMQSAIDGVGDGVVTIQSTQLDGVHDHHIVEGDHVSMIVNIIKQDRVPPAIPIVLDRLRASTVDEQVPVPDDVQ